MTAGPVSLITMGYRSTNYYVVCAGTTRLLVDLGWPGQLGALRAELQRKSLALTDITHGFATHYHPDHAGLAQELKASGMTLIVTPEQTAAAPAMTRWTKPEEHFVPIVIDAKTRVVPIADSRAYLATLGLAGQLVHTPGHSDDSVSLLLDDGRVFTGDLTLRGMAPEEAVATVDASWQRLEALGATQVYPGHGKPYPVRRGLD
jgi:glyoxylase-like metal-dependent hydrolase (beta-lactamase superfamily II)